MSDWTCLLKRCLLSATLLAPLSCDGGATERAQPTKRAAKSDAKPDAKPDEKPKDAPPTAAKGLKGMEVDFMADPRPPKGDMVFFSSHGGPMVPLGCYDAATKSLAGGPACLDRAPKDAQVFVTGLEMSSIGTLGDRVKGLCDKVGTPPDARALVGATQAYDWGTWPKSGTLLVVQTLPGDLGPKNSEPTPEDLVNIKSFLKRAGARLDAQLKRGASIAVQQDLALDLDGDDVLERVLSLTVRPPGKTQDTPEDRLFAWSGLLVTGGADAERVTLVESATNEDAIFLMRGTVDLKGTRSRLLWTMRLKGEAMGDRLVEIDAEPVRHLADWTCPVESDAAPAG